jgi:hypothetical protein
MKTLLKVFGTIALCGVALFALIIFGAKWDTEQKIQQAKQRSAAAEERAGQITEAIKNKQLIVGMTYDNAIASWGNPGRRNVSGGAGGDREQWIYGDIGAATYVYFQGGRLTSWQQNQPGSR